MARLERRGPDPTYDTKEIVIGTGGYRADGVKKAGSSFAANVSAVVVVSRHTIKGTCDIVGCMFYTGNGGSGLGEQTNTGNAVDCYGNLALDSDKTKKFNLTLPNSTTRVLTLASGELREMRCYPFRAQNQELLANISWDLPTSAAEFFPGGRPILYVAGQHEDATQFNNASVATNETDARTEADLDPLVSYSTGNVALTANMPGTSTYPKPVGIIARVKSSHRHFAIIGTSRESGNGNPFPLTSREDDSYPAMALHANGYTFVNLAMGASALYQDWIPPYANVYRMEMMRGVTDIFLGHNQNDLFSRTLTQFQTDMKTFYDYWSKRGVKVWINTMDPWVQKATSTNNAIDEYYDTGYPLASSGTETKRLAYNDWVRGITALCVGGSGTITLGQICDGVVDTAVVVENAASPGQWKTPAVVDTGTVTAGPSAPSTTLASNDQKSWTPLEHHDRLIRFGSGGTAGWGIIRTNGTLNVLTAALATTYPNTQITTWGTGSGALTPTAGQSYTIYEVLTRDGIHASYAGRVLQAAVVSAFFPVVIQ